MTKLLEEFRVSESQNSWINRFVSEFIELLHHVFRQLDQKYHVYIQRFFVKSVCMRFILFYFIEAEFYGNSLFKRKKVRKKKEALWCQSFLSHIQLGATAPRAAWSQ